MNIVMNLALIKYLERTVRKRASVQNHNDKNNRKKILLPLL